MQTETNLYEHFLNESKKMFSSFGIGTNDDKYKNAIHQLEEEAKRKVKIITEIENNKGYEIAFEGCGIMSGINTFDYKIYSIDIDRMIIKIERRKKLYCKNIYDILSGKENFAIRQNKTKQIIFKTL